MPGLIRSQHCSNIAQKFRDFAGARNVGATWPDENQKEAAVNRFGMNLNGLEECLTHAVHSTFDRLPLPSSA
jgi:hypothetical protein